MLKTRDSIWTANLSNHCIYEVSRLSSDLPQCAASVILIEYELLDMPIDPWLVWSLARSRVCTLPSYDYNVLKKNFHRSEYAIKVGILCTAPTQRLRHQCEALNRYMYSIVPAGGFRHDLDLPAGIPEYLNRATPIVLRSVKQCCLEIAVEIVTSSQT